MVASWTTVLLLAALLNGSIHGVFSFDCNKLDANTNVEDVFKNECADIASPNGDFDLVVTDSNKDAFNEWIRDKLQTSSVNILIENTQMNELVFPNLVNFKNNAKFIVRNNAELTNIHFANSWFEAEQVTISDNPKLESITGIRHNTDQKIVCKTTFENNSQLKTLWLKQIILSETSISNNPELEDLQLTGGILHSDVIIRNNKKLRKIGTTVKMHTTNVTLTIEGNEELMELDFTSVGQFVSSNLRIRDNKALEIVKFKDNLNWFQFKKMEFSGNEQLKTITLPTSVDSKTFIDELILLENGKLETFAPLGSLDASSTNTTIQFCPNLKNIDEIKRNSNLEFSNFDKYDVCKFPTPLANLTELEPCNAVDGDLQLADNAIGSAANCAIAEIRGDLNLRNNEAAKLGCLLMAKTLGEVSSTICDFDYSIFPNAGTTAKPISCSATITSTLKPIDISLMTDKPSNPSPFSNSPEENEQISAIPTEESTSNSPVEPSEPSSISTTDKPSNPSPFLDSHEGNEPEPNNESDSSTSSMGTGTIAGISIGVLLIILLVAGVAVFMRKKKKAKAAAEKDKKDPTSGDKKDSTVKTNAVVEMDEKMPKESTGDNKIVEKIEENPSKDAEKPPKETGAEGGEN